MGVVVAGASDVAGASVVVVAGVVVDLGIHPLTRSRVELSQKQQIKTLIF